MRSPVEQNNMPVGFDPRPANQPLYRVAASCSRASHEAITLCLQGVRVVGIDTEYMLEAVVSATTAEHGLLIDVIVFGVHALE
jgi:hypothetical protein